MHKQSLILLFFLMIFFPVLAQQQGYASYYSQKLKGRKVSDGSRYHPDSMTCAHRTYPFGSKLLVKNLKNGKFTYVKVTDRGPHTKGRIIDLSYKAAKEIGMLSDGIVRVEVSLTDFWPQMIKHLMIPKRYLPVDTINTNVHKLFKQKNVMDYQSERLINDFTN